MPLLTEPHLTTKGAGKCSTQEEPYPSYNSIILKDAIPLSYQEKVFVLSQCPTQSGNLTIKFNQVQQTERESKLKYE